MSGGSGAWPWLRRVARAPLLHFLAIGAAIHVLAEEFGGGRDPASYRITIGAGQVESLVSAFARARGRPPVEDELAGLIEEQVKEEVYFREALALGLDRGDLAIRRRLRQKLEFIAADATGGDSPEEAQRKLYERARARYTIVIERPAAAAGEGGSGEEPR